MGYDMFRGSRDEKLEVSTAERGLAALIEVAERAVEKIGSSVPPAQLRALLIIDRAGSLNLNRLASRPVRPRRPPAGSVTGWRSPDC